MRAVSRLPATATVSMPAAVGARREQRRHVGVADARRFAHVTPAKSSASALP